MITHSISTELQSLSKTDADSIELLRSTEEKGKHVSRQLGPLWRIPSSSPQDALVGASPCYEIPG